MARATLSPTPLWGELRTEIGVALAARDAAAPALAVGTNGWCLGPGDNSSYFDAVVADPRFSLAAIDGCLGWCAVDPGFASVRAHPATVIAWMEDDLGLAGGQLWVQRTLDHAADATRYKASGLMGLLWRTFETTPQVAALAAAGWNTSSASGSGNTSSALGSVHGLLHCQLWRCHCHPVRAALPLPGWRLPWRAHL